MDWPLPGIEHDNLLGILAAVGCLRALDTARPHWRPRLSWRGSRCVLHVDAEAGEADIAEVVDEGVVKLGEAYRMLPGDHPKWSQAVWRQILAAGADLTTMFAIGSEVLGTVNKKGEFGAKQCSPLVMLNGGSHQDFLLHLRALVEPQPTVRVGRSSKEIAIDAKDRVCASLFAPWARGENGRRRALRWDHQEVRDHGSRWLDPNEEDDMPIEWGAYRMAAVGWPVYRCGVRRGRLVTAATTAHRGFPGTIHWPIWERPRTWHGVATLWLYPELIEGRPPSEDTTTVMAARRYNNAKGVGYPGRAVIRSEADASSGGW